MLPIQDSNGSNETPLVSKWSRVQKPAQSPKNRADLALKFQRDHSPSKSVRLCGKGVLKKYDSTTISVFETEGKTNVSFSGISSCGAHYCVRCARKERAHHAKQIGLGLNHAIELGHKVFLGTFTLGSCEMNLQVAHLRKAYSATTQFLRREFDKLGFPLMIYKAYDFTINENKKESSALHLHLHFALITPDVPGVEDVLERAQRFYVRKIRKLGGSAVEVAQEIAPARSADAVGAYVAKLVNEVANTADKTSRAKVGGGLSLVPWIYKISNEPTTDKRVRIYRRVINALKGLRIFSSTKAFRDMSATQSANQDAESDKKEPLFQIELGARAYSALAETNRLNEFSDRLSKAVSSQVPADVQFLETLKSISAFSLHQKADDFLLDDWVEVWNALLNKVDSVGPP